MGQVFGQHEGGRVEHVGIVYNLALAVIALAGVELGLGVRETHGVATFGKRAVAVEGGVEGTVLSEVEINKSVHPVAGVVELRSERFAGACCETLVEQRRINFQRGGAVEGLLSVGRAFEHHAVQAAAAMSICLVDVKVEGIILGRCSLDNNILQMAMAACCFCAKGL